MKPIEYRCESYKAKKSLSELLVSSSHAPESFYTGKEVLNHMAMTVERFGEVILDTAGVAWGNTSDRTGIGQVLPKALRVEAAIANDPAASEHGNQRVDGAKVVPISSDEIQSDGTPEAVDNRSQFCVRSAFGSSDCLCRRAARGIGRVLMNFDVAAIDTAQLTRSTWYQQFVHLRPEFGLTPPAEARVDRAPRAKLLWQVTPRRSRTKDEVYSTHHDSIFLRWSAAGAPSGHTSCTSVIRSIFLSAPRADQESPNDLMYSL
jgi:hypothetical protein